jgi:hypothetical protein
MSEAPNPPDPDIDGITDPREDITVPPVSQPISAAQDVPPRSSLPDLTDPAYYPTAGHTDTCVDTWTPYRNCLDQYTDSPPYLIRITRPWSFTTVTPAQLSLPWATRATASVPVVPLVPPSLGTLCPVPSVQPGTSQTGTTGALGLTIQPYNGDTCQLEVIPSVVFPCTQILPGNKTINLIPAGSSVGAATPVGSITGTAVPTSSGTYTGATPFTYTVTVSTAGMANGAAQVTVTSSPSGDGGGPYSVTSGSSISVGSHGAKVTFGPTTSATLASGNQWTITATTGAPTWVQTVTNNFSGNSCISIVSDTITLPVLGSGSSSAASSASGFTVGTMMNHTPDPTSPCATAYPPGSVVPIYDGLGLLGTAGTEVDPTANTLTNASNSVLSVGDTVSLSAEFDSPATPKLWSVLPA